VRWGKLEETWDLKKIKNEPEGDKVCLEKNQRHAQKKLGKHTGRNGGGADHKKKG